MSELSVVGKRLPPVGAANKVTGAAKYSVDIALPGMLVGKVLHSPHAHARIRSIDASRARALPGVAAVLTWEDVPQDAFNPSIQDWMIHDLSFDVRDMYVISEKARFIGDIVAAVAAVDEETALAAMRLIDVDYEVLPGVFDMASAMEPGAPLVHDWAEGNISRAFQFPGSRGDVAGAVANAAVVVEETVTTSKQYMMPLEPLTVVAAFDPSGTLTLWMPCQRPMTFAKKIAQLFGLPDGRVNLVCEYGGGFFGEANWTPAPICVALAKAALKPVKLELTREETVLNSASREVYVGTGTAAFAADGTLTALKEELLVDSGAYFNRSSACTMVGMAGFSGLYRCPTVLGEAKAVYSNVPMASGARGYGGPAAFFLLEQLMDKAAEELAMDPVELRLKNSKQMGDFGHAFPIETATLSSVITTGAEKIGWAEKKQRDRADGTIRRGVGMGAYYDVSGGQPFERFDRNVEMHLGEDGSVTAIFNHPDGGMNLLGTVAQIAAEVLGVRYEDVHFVTASTEGKLYDAGMAANSGLYTVGNAIFQASTALREEILSVAGQLLDVPVAELSLSGGSVRRDESGGPVLTLAELAHKAIYGSTGPSRAISVTTSYHPTANPNPFGAAFADVAVDLETGEIKIEKLVLVHDIGRAINPMTVEGQLEGGMSLGVGYALFEDASIDPETGRLRGDNFNTYRLPSTLDLPEMDVVLWEEPAPSGPFGGKGVGMCGVIGIAPAIANAVYDATGVRLTELPMTPERVLDAIKRDEAASPSGTAE